MLFDVCVPIWQNLILFRIALCATITEHKLSPYYPTVFILP